MLIQKTLGGARARTHTHTHTHTHTNFTIKPREQANKTRTFRHDYVVPNCSCYYMSNSVSSEFHSRLGGKWLFLCLHSKHVTKPRQQHTHAATSSYHIILCPCDRSQFPAIGPHKIRLIQFENTVAWSKKVKTGKFWTPTCSRATHTQRHYKLTTIDCHVRTLRHCKLTNQPTNQPTPWSRAAVPSSPASREISTTLPISRCTVQLRSEQPATPLLRPINSVHELQCHLFKIHFNIILPSMPRSPTRYQHIPPHSSTHFTSPQQAPHVSPISSTV